MCYMQQRRNYVARRNKILVCINRNLEKYKIFFNDIRSAKFARKFTRTVTKTKNTAISKILQK